MLLVMQKQVLSGLNKKENSNYFDPLKLITKTHVDF